MRANPTNVAHGLSTPPPIKPGKVAPREGLLPCRESCPYRRRYGCEDEDRDLGRSVGFCVLEYYQANPLFQEAVRDVDWLPEVEREEMILVARQWHGAMTYVRRALTWQAEVFDDHDHPDRAERLDTAQRYVEAGQRAREKLWAALREHQERARIMRVSCGTWKALVAARKMLEVNAPELLKPKRLVLVSEAPR